MPLSPRFSPTQQLLPVPSKRRSGQRISTVQFLVAHDTGNPESTAEQNVRYYTRTAQEQSASAHIFVDHTQILECIPAFQNPEKAWHVRYDVATDNELYGVNANDAAIGVEYCYGTGIHADAAYDRYVWTLAWLCSLYGLQPDKHIVGHFFLDPKRRSDPVTGLAHSRRSYEQLLRDVALELSGQTPPPPVVWAGQGTVRVRANLRLGSPSTRAPVVTLLAPQTRLTLDGKTDQGEAVNGNRTWFFVKPDRWIWSGAVHLETTP